MTTRKMSLVLNATYSRCELQIEEVNDLWSNWGFWWFLDPSEFFFLNYTSWLQRNSKEATMVWILNPPKASCWRVRSKSMALHGGCRIIRTCSVWRLIEISQFTQGVLLMKVLGILSLPALFPATMRTSVWILN